MLAPTLSGFSPEALQHNSYDHLGLNVIQGMSCCTGISPWAFHCETAEKMTESDQKGQKKILVWLKPEVDKQGGNKSILCWQKRTTPANKLQCINVHDLQKLVLTIH